jgi:hypothetical protein
MNNIIERYFSRNESLIISNAALASILSSLGFRSIKDKIYDLRKKKILIPLKKGLYFYKSSIVDQPIPKEQIANHLLGPSYISLDYALWYHHLIPESVHHISSVSIKRAVRFENDFGIFKYIFIKPELFDIGLQIETLNNGNFLIASKEKALCDKIFLNRSLDITSKKQMFEFLEDDLRIDMDELEDFNINIAYDYHKYSKSKKIALLTQVLQNL